MIEIDPGKSLHLLANTDDDVGRLKGRVAWTDDYKKIIISQYVATHDGSINKLEHEARASEDYIQACTDHAEAVTEYNTLVAKRKTAEYAIEVFRTTEASKRKGNI